MNKQYNKLTISILATLAAGIALIYTLIQYHTSLFAVICMSLLFLLTAFIFTQNFTSYSIMKNKSLTVQLKDYIDDISTQIEAMNGIQSKLGKANYIYSKQALQSLTTLENNYIESQDALFKNLISISNSQNKATKLVLKYDQNNTVKVITALKELRSQLNDTMIQGFDQIQPNNDEIISALEDIVNYLKSQPVTSSDETLGLQLSNLAVELQNISNSIQQIQSSTQQIMYTTPEHTVSPATDNIQGTNIVNVEPQETVSIKTDAETITEDISIPETILDETITEDISIPEAISDENITEDVSALEAVAEDIHIPESTFEQTTETAAIQAPVIEENTIPAENSNKQLSPDEIAALFADAEPSANRKTSASDNEEEAFTPTFTVVSNPKPVETTPPTDITSNHTTEDSNKQLSADEIAALFADADPAPKKAGKTTQNTSVSNPASDDTSKQLSADEIAALFEDAEPIPKKASSSKEKLENDAITKVEPVRPTPVADDPNKQLSADEIAALIASMG